ncbi:uncharacterized protein ARMOST_13661 [Armillaria ostoyae]|uniref:Uncharacterized protein n=1 Tax=Armillaria ostoyae TaxID=47428 RepID=A0A284RND8_ARMOS|nr:uncharacterized protein ARMOST_13661 [Armillaria ostoyae]
MWLRSQVGQALLDHVSDLSKQSEFIGLNVCLNKETTVQGTTIRLAFCLIAGSIRIVIETMLLSDSPAKTLLLFSLVAIF